jgi:hypothetical protein
MSDHFDKLPAAQFEVYVLVIAEDVGVECSGVLERLVNVTLEDGCPDFWMALARRSYTNEV